MELNADVPYPSLDGIGEDACSLRIISPAYAGRAGELTAILQYVYQHILFERMGDGEAAETLLAVSVAEMRHFEILGTLICKLGAPPVFTNCPPYPVGYYSASAVDYSSTPQKMLLADIAAERGAIAAYNCMISKLTDERVAAVLQRIVMDEELHLEAFKKLLARMS